MHLTKETALRAMVLDWGAPDLDLHLLGTTATGNSCIKRSDIIVEGTLAAGTYHWAVDTFVAKGKAKPGAFVLLVTACDAGDSRCKTALK